MLLSLDTEDEIKQVIARPKFDKYTPPQKRLHLLADFIASAKLIEVQHTIQACRDPRDDKFLEVAVSGGADLILTGAADLLSLHPFRGIAILTPAAYLASVSETR